MTKPKEPSFIRMNTDIDNAIALRKLRLELMKKNPGASYSLARLANAAIRIGVTMPELTKNP